MKAGMRENGLVYSIKATTSAKETVYLATWSDRPLKERPFSKLLKVMTALAAQAPLAVGEWPGTVTPWRSYIRPPGAGHA
jgi:hypothetical protein